MRSKRVNASKDELLNPDSAAWSGAGIEGLDMQTPPIGNVPSNYFRSMDPTTIGAVKRLQVSSLHNGDWIFFRLAWHDPEPDWDMGAPGQFRDGAGILFPFLDLSRINNMGSKKEPVNAWCWQAGIDQPRNVTAAGLGTTRREEVSYCEANPVHEDETWKVVIARPFEVPDLERNVELHPGMKKLVGFAVWEGSNGERAGAKSFSGNWSEVEIEP